MSTSPASCCSIYLQGIVSTIKGPEPFGFATGFLYAGPNATRWLVTNWHVVTGRRPDDPGSLIGDKPDSPSRLRFTLRDPAGATPQDMDVALYDTDGPTWIEGDRERGVDLALVRLTDTPRFRLPLTQSFAPNSPVALEPGLDVVIIGHPFELGTHAGSAIWKGAMVASGRDTSVERRPWILVDTPGTPGMSGSPVYNRTLLISERETSRGGDTSSQAAERMKLELAGVYAGSVGNKDLERLQLGRVFPIGLVEDILRRGQRGINPFPPMNPPTDA
ncbi:S1 family peptidase [Bradyrhizobium sp. HKCCYLRH1034]